MNYKEFIKQVPDEMRGPLSENLIDILLEGKENIIIPPIEEEKSPRWMIFCQVYRRVMSTNEGLKPSGYLPVITEVLPVV